MLARLFNSLRKPAHNLNRVVHVCPCGSQMWQVEWMIFDDYEPAAYSTSMTCICCGAKAQTPTLCDRPEGKDKYDTFVTV